MSNTSSLSPNPIFRSLRTVKIGDKVYDNDNDDHKESDVLFIKLVTERDSFSPNPLRKL